MSTCKSLQMSPERFLAWTVALRLLQARRNWVRLPDLLNYRPGVVRSGCALSGCLLSPNHGYEEGTPGTLRDLRGNRRT